MWFSPRAAADATHGLLADGMEIFVADRVWDGTSTRPIERGFVGVEDGTIAAVGRRADLPDNSDVRDLGHITLLPGLINAHVHITFAALATCARHGCRPPSRLIEKLTVVGKEEG